MEGGKEFLIPRLENSAISLISCPRGLRVYRAGPIFNILKSYTLSLFFFFVSSQDSDRVLYKVKN